MDKNEFLKDVIDKGQEAHERTLKPCPFCGGRKISLHQEKDADGYWSYYLSCCACEAQSSVRSYPRATFDPNLHELWNNRINTETKEVKHGRWIDFPECLEYEGALDSDYFVCSECHHVWNTIDNCAETFKYCPNCGSKNEGAEKFKYYPNCGSKNEDGDNE